MIALFTLLSFFFFVSPCESYSFASNALATEVYFAAASNVFQSSCLGKDWKNAPFATAPNASFGWTSIASDASGAFFALTSADALYTYDATTSQWETSLANIEFTVTMPGSVAMSSNGSMIVAILEYTNSQPYIFVSHNYGRNWSKTAIPYDGNVYEYNLLSMSANGQYIIAGHAGSNNQQLSTNFGQSFTQTIYSSSSVFGFAMNSLGDKMYLNSYYDVQLSADYGTSWKTVLHYVFSTYAPILCDESGNYLYIALSSSMQMYSTNSGGNWTTFPSSISADVYTAGKIVISNPAITEYSSTMQAAMTLIVGNVGTQKIKMTQYSIPIVIVEDNADAAAKELTAQQNLESMNVITKSSKKVYMNCPAAQGYYYYSAYSAVCLSCEYYRTLTCSSSDFTTARKCFNNGDFLYCDTCSQYPVSIADETATSCYKECPYPLYSIVAPTYDVNSGALTIPGTDMCGMALQGGIQVVFFLIASAIIFYGYCLSLVLQTYRNCIKPPPAHIDINLLATFIIATILLFLDTFSDLLFLVAAVFYRPWLFALATVFFILHPISSIIMETWSEGYWLFIDRRLLCLSSSSREDGWQERMSIHSLKKSKYANLISIMNTLYLPFLLCWEVIRVSLLIVEGFFLYSTKMMCIGPLYNAWLTRWCGRPMQRTRKLIETQWLKKEVYSGIVLESLPQLLLQVYNTISLGELSLINIFSIVSSSFMIFSGLYRMFFLKVIYKQRIVDEQTGLEGFVDFAGLEPSIDGSDETDAAQFIITAAEIERVLNEQEETEEIDAKIILAMNINQLLRLKKKLVQRLALFPLPDTTAGR